MVSIQRYSDTDKPYKLGSTVAHSSIRAAAMLTASLSIAVFVSLDKQRKKK